MRQVQSLASDRRFRRRDDVLEFLIARDFDCQLFRSRARCRRTTRPQQDAVGMRIAGCDALRIQLAPFRPLQLRLTCAAACPGQGRAECCR